MVYMNGDNNLEPDAVNDFLEMARVGSSPEVRVLVQMDRIASPEDWDDSRYGDWTGTLRFEIIAGMTPEPRNAVPATEGGLAVNSEVDMGSPESLRDFLDWAQQRRPAKRYALVIWDHGAGWRVFARAPVAQRRVLTALLDSVLTSDTLGLVRLDSTALSALAQPVRDHPVRSVSHDETSRSELFNAQIQNTLESLQQERRVDLIGFDACLMAMVETAYALRNAGDVLVASEELEPGAGWRYDLILRALARSPTMDAPAFGRAIVESYEIAWSQSGSGTTLSAVDLRRIPELGAAIDTFATELAAAIPEGTEQQIIRRARSACRTYGRSSTYHNVDVVCFANRVAGSTARSTLETAAQRVAGSVANVVIRNYADSEMADESFGSHGLAIYFPPDRICYQRDPLSPAYQNANRIHPVQFVMDRLWDEWLQTYTRYVTGPPPECPGSPRR